MQATRNVAGHARPRHLRHRLAVSARALAMRRRIRLIGREASRPGARQGRLDPCRLTHPNASAPHTPYALFGVLRAASRSRVGRAASRRGVSAVAGRYGIRRTARGSRIGAAARRRGLGIGGAASGAAGRGGFGIGSAAGAGHNVIEIAHLHSFVSVTPPWRASIMIVGNCSQIRK